MFNFDYFKNVKKNSGRRAELGDRGASSKHLWLDLSDHSIYYNDRSDVPDAPRLLGVSDHNEPESCLQARMASWLPSRRPATFAPIAVRQRPASAKQSRLFKRQLWGHASQTSLSTLRKENSTTFPRKLQTSASYHLAPQQQNPPVERTGSIGANPKKNQSVEIANGPVI